MKTDKLILICILFLVPGCKGAVSEGVKPAAPPVTVRTSVVQELPMASTLLLTGSIVANQQADVAANASGRVVKVFVDRGTSVSKDDPLVQLDTSTLSLNLVEAEANLKNAEAVKASSDAQCTRDEDLFKKGILTPENWEKVQAQCATAGGTVEAARVRVDLTRKMIRDATVRAPFSGIVGERFINVGEFVQNSGRVVTLVQVDPVRIQLGIPEKYLSVVAVGNLVDFTVSTFPGDHFQGKVSSISPSVRAASRDMIFEGMVPNPDGRLRPGMFTQAMLNRPDAPVPALPVDTILHRDARSYVFVVVDGRVEERLVQIGSERDGYVAVLDGIRAGETVVNAPGEDVRDGVSVR